MDKVMLGKTGLEVSRLALGGLFVNSNNTELDEAKKAIHRAVNLGINYSDTAPGYGNSEEVLGQGLEGIDDVADVPRCVVHSGERLRGHLLVGQVLDQPGDVL